MGRLRRFSTDLAIDLDPLPSLLEGTLDGDDFSSLLFVEIDSELMGLRDLTELVCDIGPECESNEISDLGLGGAFDASFSFVDS